MIITTDHPDCPNIKIYGKNGKLISQILEVDTDTMIGKQFVEFDYHSNKFATRDVDVYKIVGPSIYYERKLKRLINTRK